MSSTLSDELNKKIKALLKCVNSRLESESNVTEWKAPLDIVLYSLSKMVNDSTNTPLIAKVQATRDKFNKIFNLDYFYKYHITDKYMNISSIFGDKADHIQFVAILQCIEEGKLTKQIPFDINKAIAEYSTGKIKSCYNIQCENEIFTMNGSLPGYEPVFIHCNKTNRYFCQQHIEETDICGDCDAVQWIPDSVKCDASECEDEYSCQYDECEYFVDKNLKCDGCDRIICSRRIHEDDGGISHCDQCKHRICQKCWVWCDFCEDMICKQCSIKYASKCISEKCNISIINHPSCKKDCQCQIDQTEVCIYCVKHSCNDYGKMPTKVLNVCGGTNCNICQSIQ